MAEAGKRRIRKANLKTKLDRLLNEYKNVLIATVDNVGSNQMQKVRIALRGKAEILMGKNTIMRKVIREHAVNNPNLEALLPHVWGNIGFVFTNQDLKQVREIVLKNKVPAVAKSGTFAPTDVFVPPGPTGLDPGQTAFFQALNIATKIARGSIEIINTVHLIKKGDKVTSSAVALLTKLDIKPFFYGIVVIKVYENGSVYEAGVLDLGQADLFAKFFSGVRKVAALSLAIGYPTIASLPQLLGSGFRRALAISLATNYEIKEAKLFKEAAAAAPAAGAASKGEEKKGGGDAKKPEAKKEEEPKEEEEEDDMGLGGGLFGDD
jgi:large subunit ribosomal protein LP0